MMKKYLLLALASLLLPMEMTAQQYAYYKDPDTGLEYLYDKDTDPTVKANQMIYIGGDEYGSPGDLDYFVPSEFIFDQSLRPQWRKNILKSDAANFWPRENADGRGLDQVTKITAAEYATGVRVGSTSTYVGVEYFINLEELEVRSENATNTKPDGTSGAADLDLSKNKKLNKLTFVVQTNKDGKFKYIDVSNTKLTSLQIPEYSADLLETLKLENLSTLTSLTFKGTGNFTKLLRLDISQTGITGSLDLSRLTALNRITIDNTKTLRSGITLRNNSSWVLTHTDGNIETWVYPNDLVNVEIWVDEEPSSDISLLDYTSMESLIVHGEASNITLPRATDWRKTKFSIDLTDGPNATINWNGNESRLTKLTLKNVDSFNATAFTSLIVLHYLEPASTSLTLSSANTALLCLDITRSGLTELDLSGGEAPNLTSVKTWYAPITRLDLTGHTALESAPYPTSTRLNPYDPTTTTKVYTDADGDHISYENLAGMSLTQTSELDPDKWPGLNLVPTPKSQIDYYATVAPNATYENGITDVDAYNAGNKLETIILNGCTSLSDVYLSHGFDLDNASTSVTHDTLVYYNPIKTVSATGCTNMTGIYVENSLINSMNLTNCTSLEAISIEQARLTGLNNDINITNCTSIKEFIADRNPWESMDFLLKAGNGRTAADVGKLEKLHVDGGTYTIMIDGTTQPRQHATETMIYTSRLKELDLSNLVNNTFKELSCEDNLLKTLDLTAIGPGMTTLRCANNMMLTLNLHSLNHATLQEGRWSPQVAYLNTEVVKGDYGTSATDGAHDWVAIHLEEHTSEGYTHKLDNNLALYNNLHQAFNDGTPIATEANPWMCLVSETTSIPDFNGHNLDQATGHHTGYHLFLHSQGEIAYKDQDLYGKVLVYQYNTGYNRELGENPISHITDMPTETKKTAGNSLNPHIQIRAHIWPYIINLNPQTMNTESQAQDAKLDYYSSTLYLDYDAVIPEGVKVYFVEGITSRNAIENGGTSPTSNQVRMRLFGDGEDINNNILPAHTPVYVRSKSKINDEIDESGVAGLYAFNPVWEFDIKGWENLKTIGDQEAPHILHGVQKNDPRKVKDVYDAPLKAAKAKKALMMGVNEDGKKWGNILTGIMGEKYPETDMTAADFNLYSRADTTLAVARTCLILAQQTQKQNTKVIGFWPYNGRKIPAHRCIILEKDYEDAVAAAEANGETISSSADAKGGSFLFIDDINVTGIETLTDESSPTTNSTGWYTLQGIRLSQQPKQRGIYIHNGRKITIK